MPLHQLGSSQPDVTDREREGLILIAVYQTNAAPADVSRVGSRRSIGHGHVYQTNAAPADVSRLSKKAP